LEDAAETFNLFTDATCVSELIAKTNVLEIKAVLWFWVWDDGEKQTLSGGKSPFSIDSLLFIVNFLRQEGNVRDVHGVLHPLARLE
jgi:hypothetical protein